jgi:hypothetical protein
MRQHVADRGWDVVSPNTSVRRPAVLRNWVPAWTQPVHLDDRHGVGRDRAGVHVRAREAAPSIKSRPVSDARLLRSRRERSADKGRELGWTAVRVQNRKPRRPAGSARLRFLLEAKVKKPSPRRVFVPIARRQLLLPIDDNYFCRRRVSKGAPLATAAELGNCRWPVAGRG